MAARTGPLNVAMWQSALHSDSALETVRFETLPVWLLLVHLMPLSHAYDRRRSACRRRRPAFYVVDAGMQIVIIRRE